jgi:hypothetical protein
VRHNGHFFATVGLSGICFLGGAVGSDPDWDHISTFYTER